MKCSQCCNPTLYRIKNLSPYFTAFALTFTLLSDTNYQIQFTYNAFPDFRAVGDCGVVLWELPRTRPRKFNIAFVHLVIKVICFRGMTEEVHETKLELTSIGFTPNSLQIV